MVARHRTADDRATHTGQYIAYFINPAGVTTSRNDVCGEERVCDDHVGNFPNVNPFEKHSKWTIRSRHQGEQFGCSGPGGLCRKLIAYPSDRAATARDPRVRYGVLDPAAIKQQLGSLLAQSSPSAPHVSLPTSLGELKDFGWLMGINYPQLFREMATAPFLEQLRAVPRLIRQFGNTLMGLAANGYISWRWIVKPMISDIRRMCQFVQATDKRQDYLTRLSSGKAVRRRVSLSSDLAEIAQPDQFMMTSTGYSAKATWSIVYSQRTWGTVKWKLSSFTRLPRGDEQRKLSMRLVTGVTSFELLQTAWELTPWSWFADWFTSLGDLISMYNNQIPAFYSDACIMRTMTAKSKFKMIPGTLPSWVVEIQPHVEEWEIKQRFTSDALWLPLLPSGLPLMDSGKWSILSALAASSADRGLPAFFRRARI